MIIDTCNLCTFCMIINNFKLKFLFWFVSGLHDEPGRLQIWGIVCNVKLNFLFLNHSILCGFSKEPSL